MRTSNCPLQQAAPSRRECHRNRPSLRQSLLSPDFKFGYAPAAAACASEPGVLSHMAQRLLQGTDTPSPSPSPSPICPGTGTGRPSPIWPGAGRSPVPVPDLSGDGDAPPSPSPICGDQAVVLEYPLTYPKGVEGYARGLSHNSP